MLLPPIALLVRSYDAFSFSPHCELIVPFQGGSDVTSTTPIVWQVNLRIESETFGGFPVAEKYVAQCGGGN